MNWVVESPPPGNSHTGLSFYGQLLEQLSFALLTHPTVFFAVILTVTVILWSK